jgi:hypothetical protein
MSMFLLPLGAQAMKAVVFTGGGADAWRYVPQGEWGEHLLYGPSQLYAARSFYYKGLLDYPSRFARYLEPLGNAQVSIINLDREQPSVDLAGVDLVVLDDVRASAFANDQKVVADYVRAGGKLLVASGAYMLGGYELQKNEVPTLPTHLIADPAGQGWGSASNSSMGWSYFNTTSSYRKTPLEGILPVEIISQPDLIVLNRKMAGGGVPLPIALTEESSFLAGLPLDTWQVYGYHAVTPKKDARVLATIGDEGHPLLVRGKAGKGEVLVCTANELEGALRANGNASAITVVTPKIGEEVLLWDFADLLWLGAAHALLRGESTLAVTAPETVAVGQGCPVTLALPAQAEGATLDACVEPVGDGAVLRGAAIVAQFNGTATELLTATLAEGRYRIVVTARKDGVMVASGAAALTVTPRKQVAIERPDRWAVLQGGEVILNFGLKSDTALMDAAVICTLRDAAGLVRGQARKLLGALAAGSNTPVRVKLYGVLRDGQYTLTTELVEGDAPVSRTLLPVAIRPKQGTPEMFMMVAGAAPSYPVYFDMQRNNAVMTVQEGDIKKFMPYMEQFGGIPRCMTVGIGTKELGEAASWRNAEGKPTVAKWGIRVSWADEAALALRDAQIKKVTEQIKGRICTPVLLFDDEPALPMDGGYEAGDRFKAQYGIDPPKPTEKYDAKFLDQWVKWNDFRANIWGDFYRRASQAAKSVDPTLKTAVVVEGMGVDVYQGFNPAISQKGLDVYWFHIYPLNEPLTMVAHCADRGMSAMRAMGERKETWALLQNWSDQSQVPHVPPAEYIREQYWMSISHGIQAVGYWPYAYGWWISPGTPGWAEMGRISRMQSWIHPLLKELEPVRKPIGLLYSQSQGSLDHLRGLVEKDVQGPVQPWHNWHANEEAYFALKSGQFAFETLEETELLATKGALPYKAVVLSRVEYLRPEAVAALKAFQKAGGVVLADESSTIRLRGLKRLPTNFDQIFGQLIFPPDASLFNDKKHRQYYLPITQAQIQEIKPTLAKYDDDFINLSHPRVVWNTLRGGNATYLFLVNDAVETHNPDQYRSTIKDWRLAPAEWSASETTVDICHRGLVYDVLTGDVVPVKQVGDRQQWSVTLEPGGGMMYALLPSLPSRLQIQAVDTVAQGTSMTCIVNVLDSAGQVYPASLPMRVRLNGTPVEARFTTNAGQGSSTLYIPGDVAPGTHILEFTEMVTGLTQSLPITVQAGKVQPLSIE